MSQENLGLARHAVAAFNRRDVPALVEMVTDDFQWVTWTGTVQSTVYHGAGGLASYFQDSDVWEVLNLEATSSATSAPRSSWSERERRLTKPTLPLPRHAGGGGSGLEIHAPYYSAFFMTDGKLARVLSFRTEAEALEAVGPRE
jgi:hypothetical protein